MCETFGKQERPSAAAIDSERLGCLQTTHGLCDCMDALNESGDRLPMELIAGTKIDVEIISNNVSLPHTRD